LLELRLESAERDHYIPPDPTAPGLGGTPFYILARSLPRQFVGR